MIFLKRKFFENFVNLFSFFSPRACLSVCQKMQAGYGG